jgi:DNA-binding NarL/FixJ family response regulator
MSIAISSALSTVQVSAANSPSTAAQQQVQPQVQQPAQQPASASSDTVTLTEAQQVYNLYNQGQTVTQISSSLALPVSTVNNYLGITQSGG